MSRSPPLQPAQTFDRLDRPELTGLLVPLARGGDVGRQPDDFDLRQLGRIEGAAGGERRFGKPGFSRALDRKSVV